MTSDEFDRMVVQGGVKLMLENDRKCLERGGMILAKEFEGELWVKASDLEKKVTQAVEAEREACAALCFRMWNEWLDSSVGDDFLDTSNCPDAEDCAAAIRARGQK